MHNASLMSVLCLEVMGGGFAGRPVLLRGSELALVGGRRQPLVARVQRDLAGRRGRRESVRQPQKWLHDWHELEDQTRRLVSRFQSQRCSFCL